MSAQKPHTRQNFAKTDAQAASATASGIVRERDHSQPCGLRWRNDLRIPCSDVWSIWYGLGYKGQKPILATN